MKLVTRIWDMLLGLSLFGLSSWVLYMAIHEMIYESSGWYDAEDWLYSLIGSVVFMLIAYVGIKMVVYPIKNIIWYKKLKKLENDKKVGE